MKSNPLLKWLLVPMVLLVLLVGLKLASGGHGAKTAPADPARLTPEEMKAVGVDGDTPRDTVATLVAQVKQLRAQLQTSLNDNKNQKDENERLRSREDSIDQRIQTALDGARGKLEQDRDQVANDRQQTRSLLQDLQHRLDALSGKGSAKDDSADLPIGLGLEDGDGKGLGKGGGKGRRKVQDGALDNDGVRWIEPEDAKLQGKAGSAPSDSAPGMATSFGSASVQADRASDAAPADEPGHDEAASSVEPVYTLPANSTLMGSVAMTALIGRVPIDGTVSDPYPFKVLIGPDNLTANGIDLPEVAGAVVSGTASGDWTLSCVRGQIRSVTFVFRDGTVRTLPDDSKGSGGAGGQSGGQASGQGNGSILGGLGWISDPYGVPCVTGEPRSNAQQYLGSQALITAAGAGAASLIKPGSGDQVVASSSNGSLGTVGIGGNAAMGRILANGVQDAADWVNKLYGQAFAAVYVPPGAKVAVHLEHSLRIDYDAKGRRVNHRLGESHASDLD